MPARRGNPGQLLAAVSAQREALGWPPWTGGSSEAALARGCLTAVLAAVDDGAEPLRPALRTAVRYLLDLLAEKAPGRAVEVRVPPYAAVQCVAGPRHTRGTPANVVETDPVTWLLLATGRLSWAEAAGLRLRASGPRADLSAYLPLAEAGRGSDST